MRVIERAKRVCVKLENILAVPLIKLFNLIFKAFRH